ncbi:unnamed protein product [Cuscuta campestris]|uniref:Uncharacterized protein n=1 Tax=Cuscuta campestris TaxID=132261 RepID=A0A484LY76_9ASTE|nr:unnamed protein product [Cuscuta campestris]
MPVNLAALLFQDMMKQIYGPKFPGAVLAGWELHEIHHYEAVSFGRWAIRRAAFQDGILDGVAEVYYVGPHGWEPILYDDVLNAGLYNPISVHSVDQEEPTNEDREWMDRLQSLEKYQKQVLPSV